ncbi:MAG: ATP-binding protein [Myxococcales bacterium]|nr:ATP-binding protein [Myxococcales bacterium]
MTTAHLVVGLPCSGKSVYAAALQKETGAVLFTLDHWLIEAFGRQPLGEAGHPEHVCRVLKVRRLILNVACQVLARGLDVILDDGFFLRKHRRQVITEVNGCGGAAKIHHLNPPLEVILDRLAKRNDFLPEHNFYIEDALFMRFAALFEAPTDGEGAQLLIANAGGNRDP